MDEVKRRQIEKRRLKELAEYIAATQPKEEQVPEQQPTTVVNANRGTGCGTILGVIMLGWIGCTLSSMNEKLGGQNDGVDSGVGVQVNDDDPESRVLRPVADEESTAAPSGEETH